MVAVHLQGPLFVSMFNPLVLVFVAIAGFLVLDEKLYVGTLLGSTIVIMGLYMALWGKSKEIRTSYELKPSGSSKDVNDASNAATTTTTLQDLCLAHTTTLIVNEDNELVVKSPMEAHKEQVTIEEV
uniref:WAT1-related protein At1g09380-like n=1 Tax=Erigeron canadensis TaxID=72917 RepID=UPI001CB8FBF5|nr:WAT1-related protein At1g09380-like [Erigeron canadensis]